VVIEKKVEAAAIGVPKPAADLQVGSAHYKVTIEMGGQQMELKVTSSIADGGSNWAATDLIEMPQGTITETSTIAKGTLVLLKEKIEQGPVSIDLDFAGDKATGKMNMNGQEMPISVDLGGPLFADAAGAEEVIACLPLAEGYSTTFRNFDAQTQKVKLEKLAVAGVEKVTVPAGSFDAYKVDVSSADGGSDKKTLWIAKDSKKVVKVTAVLASLGGALLTEELAAE